MPIAPTPDRIPTYQGHVAIIHTEGVRLQLNCLNLVAEDLYRSGLLDDQSTYGDTPTAEQGIDLLAQAGATRINVTHTDGNLIINGLELADTTLPAFLGAIDRFASPDALLVYTYPRTMATYALAYNGQQFVPARLTMTAEAA